MSYENFYSTKQLEAHICGLYDKVVAITKSDGVYESIQTIFSSKFFIDGRYCFSANDGYHFCYVERGVVSEEKVTKSLLEIVYCVLESQILEMAVNYECKHRIEKQDSRRMIFSKALQYLNAIGKEYAEMAELEYDNILKVNPFRD